ncbi:hypothetical protein MRS44_018267 [Fusarium solani]|uniref:uncharacterized protein n=1 Tax=Fusarium solani TaxID=169388 RepID=UPI0032C44896|nr:hypothetical protein MRS44_018169 [Fusarium solani]KAJ3454373.1 hypothetical protein MRS44_018267 [Fusarium solani]
MRNLPTRDNDLAQIRLASGMDLENIARFSSDDRRAILCKYLTDEKPIVIQEPIAWSDEKSIGRFFLLKKFLEADESRQQLLQEARQVFYEENAFIVSWAGFSRFLDDMLGDWIEAAPVESLVRDLTVIVERHECQCGQLMEYMEHASHFAKLPQLQRISFEWRDSFGGAGVDASGRSTPLRYDIENDANDANDADDDTDDDTDDNTNGDNNSTNDDSTDYDQDSDRTLMWDTSDDDIWSLDGNMEN